MRKLSTWSLPSFRYETPSCLEEQGIHIESSSDLPAHQTCQLESSVMHPIPSQSKVGSSQNLTTSCLQVDKAGNIVSSSTAARKKSRGSQAA